MSVFELARIIGTFVRLIEHHYGMLLGEPGPASRRLDAFDDEAGEGRQGRKRAPA